jgi:cell division septum initiation protein DivIVA
MKPSSQSIMPSCYCHMHTKCERNMSFDSSISSAVVAISQDSKQVKAREVSSDVIEELQQTADVSDVHSRPPVGEIRIPTPSSDSQDTAFKVNSATDDAFVETEDYKTLYFCGQRDLFEVQQRVEYVCEDNRLLKRKIIELQKQLYHNTRTRRRIVHADSAWCIPGEAPQTPVKSSQTFAATQNESERHVTVSPGTESRCRIKRVSIAGDASP